MRCCRTLCQKNFLSRADEAELSPDVVQGLFYYLPVAWPMGRPPNNRDIKVSIAARAAIVCIESDVSCRAAAAHLLTSDSGSVSDVTFAKTFLGYRSPPQTYRIAVAPIRHRL